MKYGVISIFLVLLSGFVTMMAVTVVAPLVPAHGSIEVINQDAWLMAFFVAGAVLMWRWLKRPQSSRPRWAAEEEKENTVTRYLFTKLSC